MGTFVSKHLNRCSRQTYFPHEVGFTLNQLLIRLLVANLFQRKCLSGFKCSGQSTLTQRRLALQAVARDLSRNIRPPLRDEPQWKKISNFYQTLVAQKKIYDSVPWVNTPLSVCILSSIARASVRYESHWGVRGLMVGDAEECHCTCWLGWFILTRATMPSTMYSPGSRGQLRYVQVSEIHSSTWYSQWQVAYLDDVTRQRLSIPSRTCLSLEFEKEVLPLCQAQTEISCVCDNHN